MDTRDKQRIKKNGIVYATLGLLFALLVALALRALGFTAFTTRQWLASLALTLAVQSALWLVPHMGWDQRLGWDPHYLYLPMVTAALQLNLYISLVPQARYLILFIWFVASLFMVGLAGFRDVVLMSAVMSAGYLAVLNRLMAGGQPMSVTFEHIFALGFFLSSVYAGVVFERLRRDRLEMKTLRRRLGELAHTDALTGLPNRREFETILHSELAAIRRYGGECSVAMLDVDFFKHYNDANGHVAGDTLLRQLADLMRGQLRGSDLLARYGGEEFGLVMHRTSKPEAQRTVERLRAVVADHRFLASERQPGGCLTISAGIAAAPEDGSDYDSLVQRADQALYTAKRAGRNRVEAA